ncbi:MAG: ATP-binding protein, partial [Promethearchaeota archaeon]
AISTEFDRVSMHGLRRELLLKQATSIKLPIQKIYLPKIFNNNEYEAIMKKEMIYFKSKNVNHVAFGDIFLEDIRKYREKNLAKIGMKAIFPLWGKSSKTLARQFLDLGFKAILICIDSTVLDGSFIGQLFNDDFLSSLPLNVDPCGENGEFHTFVFDGPIFSTPIQFEKGKITVQEDRFNFIDLK